MLLPENLLKQVEYYEDTSEKILDDGVYTKVTLHFKAWYRFKKVIRIRWTSWYNHREQTTQHTETQEAVELRNQLREYFRPKPQLTELTDPDMVDRTIRRIK
jgi:hypothetical protein